MMRTTKQLRADAALILHCILEQGKSAREVLPQFQSEHSEQDKAWLQQMVFGVLRQLPLLQYWLKKLLDKPLKNRFKVVEHLLMLGFYQLAFTRVSTHAAVSETVNANKALKTEAMRGLTNGVLRNFIRKEMEQDQPDNPQIMSGLPKWLFKRITQQYNENSEKIIQNMQQKSPLWLRVNQRQQTRDQFSQALQQLNIEHNLPELQAFAVVLEHSRDITQLPGFKQGWFAVQDGAAQLAADLLDPQPNERILDCCAAPGGKTCHILEQQPQLAECQALEIDATRLARIEENLQRLGLQATLIQGDAAKPKDWWDGRQYDRILLDAPCSATGVIRRHPDIMWLRKDADIQALVALQQQILDSVWPLLKSGGTLVYATCSILEQENHQQITQFLQKTGDATLSPLHPKDNPTHPGWQILPNEQQMDGFYYARLLKS